MAGSSPCRQRVSDPRITICPDGVSAKRNLERRGDGLGSPGTQLTKWVACAGCGDRVLICTLKLHVEQFCGASPQVSAAGSIPVGIAPIALPMETCPMCSLEVEKTKIIQHIRKCPRRRRRSQTTTTRSRKPASKKTSKKKKRSGIQIVNDRPSRGPYTFVTNTRPLQGGSPGTGKRG
jgi:hypothetical protein